jgi:hypothetical protein
MCPQSTPPGSDPSKDDQQLPKKSFGNMGPDHWTKSRGDRNDEAFEYYRERGHAPGVAEGGGPRNFYCMECDGVIPSDPPATKCPHCNVVIRGEARRYFNWVEIDTPPSSDWLALRPYFLGALLILVLLIWLIWWLI